MKKLLGIYCSVVFLQQILTIAAVNAQVRLNHPQEYASKVWNNQNGLPQNTVFGISEDRAGYLWVATEEGLVRFDGIDFKILNKENTPALSSNTFSDLTMSQHGVWAATGNKVLLVNKELLKTFDFSPHVKGSGIKCIEEDHFGRLWTGTNDGKLFYIEKDSIFSFNEWNKEPFTPVNVILSISDGILVGTDKGLFRIDQAGSIKPVKEVGFPSVRALAVDKEEALWIATAEEGILKKSAGKIENFRQRHGLNELYLTSLAIDSQGKVWVGTSSSGLQVYAEGKFTTIQEKGYSSSGIKSIYFTDNLIWLGTAASGLVQLKPSQIQMFPKDFTLSNQIILPIYEHPNNDIWIGTAGSGVNRLKDGEVIHYGIEDGLSSDLTLSIYGTADYVFIGTVKGLNRVNLKTEKVDRTYTTKDGLASNIIRTILYASDSTLWITTQAGGIHKLGVDGRIRRLNLPGEFSNSEFVSIFEDKKSNIWIGSTGSGMLSIDKNERITAYSSKTQLSSSSIYDFYEDTNGALWLGTMDGLVCFKNNQFYFFNKSHGLIFNGIYRVIDDQQGDLWLSGNYGLQRITISELENFSEDTERDTRFSFRLYDTSDGMANAETNGGVFPAGWRMKNGTLWFPTVQGIAIVNPTMIDSNNSALNMQIKSINFGDRQFTTPKDIQVPPGVFNIEIDYTNIDFTKPHNNNYYYRLRGLDNNWKSVGNRRTAYFTNLDPGKYIFEVKSEKYGSWSEVATLPFEVIPFFHQTLWFKALLLSVLFLSGFAAKQFHAKYQQEFRLKRLVDEQTKELIDSNEQLKRVNKAIEAQNLRLKEIAWTQSHIARAPLARMLGILDLIQGKNYNSSSDLNELLTLLKKSGLELDDVIREIIKKTETVNNDPKNET